MIKLIETQEDVDSFFQNISQVENVGIDTEFDSQARFGYFPAISTMQFCFKKDDKKNIIIIDCLSKKITSKKSMIDFFLNTKILKIFHSSVNDIGVIFGYLGVWPVKIFDIQTAYCMQKIAKTPPSYSSLVSEFCGKEINKSHQNSKWMKRPISDEMRLYAARDVEFLEDIYEVLSQKLIQNGNFEIFENEMTNLYKNITTRSDFAYKKQDIEHLTKLESSRVFLLTKEREMMAINLNINPEIMISNATIFSFAKLKYQELSNKIIKENTGLISFLDKITKESWAISDDFFAQYDPRDFEENSQMQNSIKKFSMQKNISKFLIASSNEVKFLSRAKNLKTNLNGKLERLFKTWRYEIFCDFL